MTKLINIFFYFISFNFFFILINFIPQKKILKQKHFNRNNIDEIINKKIKNLPF